MMPGVSCFFLHYGDQARLRSASVFAMDSVVDNVAGFSTRLRRFQFMVNTKKSLSSYIL